MRAWTQDIVKFVLRSDKLISSIIGLVAALMLGGGSRQGLPSDSALQIICIPVLGISIVGLCRDGIPPQVRLGVVFCLVLALIPLLQLIPLPTGLDHWLPFRDLIRQIQVLSGAPIGPWPISISPQTTLLAALSLIPPLALFLCCLQLNFQERRVLTLVAIGGGVVSAFLGLLQVAQGPSSPLRFYAFTNTSEAVGFFANRNHFSALLYAGWVLAAAWLSHSVQIYLAASSKAKLSARVALPMLASFLVVLVLIVAQMAARSRAGLILAGVAIVAGFVMSAVNQPMGSWLQPRRLLGLILLGTIVLSSQFALVRLLDRLAEDPLKDARIAFARNTWTAAKAFLPFGSGLGTFMPVYSMFEAPKDALLDTFANRAHNDVLELFLETGIVGPVMLALFIGWLMRRSWIVWTQGEPGMRDLDRQFARAATVAISLILAHSFVDYPLRTGAIMGVFALCCALICAPTRVTELAVAEPKIKQKRRPRQEVPDPVLDPTIGAWGNDVKWPEGWQRPNRRK